MSAGSPKFTLSRIAALSLVSLWLAGCIANLQRLTDVQSVRCRDIIALRQVAEIVPGNPRNVE